MKKVGIVTIYDNNNYGNRLQNYATQEILKKINIKCETILNEPALNKKETKKSRYFLKVIKFYLRKLKRIIRNAIKPISDREKRFNEFNQNIKFSKKYFNFMQKLQYDYFVAGSDQVWNPTFGRLSGFDLLEFADKNKIAFAASFGISELPEEHKERTQNALKKFEKISVREEQGKKIVEELTGRKDVELLIDPTMLLEPEKWDKVAKKPEQLKTDKYILNYFLGELSESRKTEIDRIAKENKCEVINILDKAGPFYQTGPAEFLYLEKNAFLICTDSFHSCVFAILYNRPFIVFDREDSLVKMNSRIETLINKFKLKNREFNGKITGENLKHDYTDAYKILKWERENSINFLKRNLEI